MRKTNSDKENLLSRHTAKFPLNVIITGILPKEKIAWKCENILNVSSVSVSSFLCRHSGRALLLNS